MIPYFTITAIPLGPIRIQVWGLFVALGIIVALLVGRAEARQRGLKAEIFLDFASWVIVFALVIARVIHAAAYEPAAFAADPWKIFKVWEGGMSSFGGFLGAMVGAAIFVRRRKINFADYASVAAYVLPLGYGIGRIGCFLIHDHPGTLSHSLLAVRFPDGPRLDHGLLLSLLGFAIFTVFLFLKKRQNISKHRFPIHTLPLFMLLYGTSRFFLDFYRAWDLPASDARYYFLTPAQYGALLFIIFGAALIIRSKRISVSKKKFKNYSYEVSS